MRAVSDRWKAAVLGVPQWVTNIDWTNDGGKSWNACTYDGGSVTCDATQQIRWAADLTVRDVAIGPKDLNPYTSRFRIRHGIQYRPGDQELIGMGYYRATSVKRSTDDADLVSLAGSSFEHYLVKPSGAFPRIRQFRAQSVRDLVEKLIKEVIPSARISWQADGDNTTLPASTATGDRWAVIDGSQGASSAARAIGARCFTGGEGEWIIARPGSLEDDPTWTASLGETQLSLDEELSIDDVYNVVSVTGQPTDGTDPVGPVVVADVDPHSPTNTRVSFDDGGTGKIIREYASSKITDASQATVVARALLAQHLGLKQSISFSRLYDPSIEPWDVGIADTPDGRLRVIADSLQYDLTGQSPLSGSTRTAESRYMGQVQEFPTIDDSN